MKSGKGKKPNGIREIARRANVAIATVDRVIHNRDGVAKKTRDKINAIIEEMDYQPNILARRLASKRIFYFAILIPKVSEETGYWKAPLKGIEQAEKEVGKYGVRVIKYFYDLNNKASFMKQANRILKSRIDGLLLTPSFVPESIKIYTACKESNVPCVFINSDIPDLDYFSYYGPHLFQSGYLVAHLIKYLAPANDKILVLNIATEIDSHHLMRKEDGFRSYLEENGMKNEIVKENIMRTDYLSVQKALSKILDNNTEIKVIFVTNARVSLVARYIIEHADLQDLILIGYDYLEENIYYLKKGIIDFLVCQKPELQGYKGIMALHDKLIMDLPVEKVNYMPIDIITKENYLFYPN